MDIEILQISNPVVIFRVSSKECDESIFIRHSIDQNNFCKGGPQISIFPCTPPRLCVGLFNPFYHMSFSAQQSLF